MAKTHVVGARFDDEEMRMLKRLGDAGSIFGYSVPPARVVRELALRAAREIAAKAAIHPPQKDC